LQRFLTRLILRYPGWVVLLGALVTLPCAYWSTRLYSNLKLDLEELLPRKAQSILDLDEVRERLQSMESLAVLVFSNDPQGSRRFVDALARSLKKLPPSVCSGVEHRINREIEFFEQRKALFIDLDDLKRLRRYIADRLDYETELYNPLNIFAENEIPEPKFPLRHFLLKYRDREQAARFSRYPGGYYATTDQKKRAVLVYLPAGASTIKGRLRLKAEVERTIRKLKPKSYAPDIEIHFTGEVQNQIDEYDAVLSDIKRSATVVTIAVTTAVLIYFKSVLGAAALFLSLFVARFWAFAFTWFNIGYLNANSAFMGSIVLGSGITYGVMVLSRYMEERRNGKQPVEAAGVAMRQTAHATWTAALAAGLAYGSLSLTAFEGFRQYGSIGFVAMLFCWLCALGLLPALLLLMERIHPLVNPRTRRNRHRIFRPVVLALSRYPKASLTLSLALTAMSLYFAATADYGRVIETDLTKLRNRRSMQSGSGYWAKHQNDIFRSYLSPVVVMPRSDRDARRIAEALKEKMAKNGDKSLMVSVRTIYDFVPRRQKEKIRELREIQALLPPWVISRLPRTERRLINTLLRPESFRPFGRRDLPELVQGKFTERNGTIGRLILVEPPLDSMKWDFDRLNRFVTELRTTAARIAGTSVPVAGSHPVTRDMFEAINHDGPRATAAAFVAVLLLVVLLFRRPFEISIVLGSLLLGVLWMAGFALGTGVKINFLNFIALPIAFGIGVDYSVNILERYRKDPQQDIIKVIFETGSAVTLCSFTTIVGYYSLIIASNQAFSSFGSLAVAGELGTMLAAIMTLPAAILLFKRRRERRGPEEKIPAEAA